MFMRELFFFAFESAHATVMKFVRQLSPMARGPAADLVLFKEKMRCLLPCECALGLTQHYQPTPGIVAVTTGQG